MQANDASIPGHDVAVAQLRRSLRKRVESFVGEVIFLNGEMEIEDPLTKRRRPAEKGIRASSECILHMKRGQAAVRLDDGTDLWLNAGATLDFSRWKKQERSIQLRAGRILALVAEELQRPFRTFTPLGQILVTGTAFEADAAADRLDVNVLHGSVQVASDRGTARAKQGQKIDATPLSAPSVARMARGADASPFRTLSASYGNQRIQAACTSAAKLLHISTNEEKYMAQYYEGTSLKKIALILALLIIPFGAGAYFWLRKPQVANPGMVVSEGRPATGSFSSGPVPKGGKIVRNTRSVIRGKDGKDIVIEGPVTAERLKELGIEGAPEMMQHAESGGTGPSFRKSGGPMTNLDDAHLEMFSREIGNSALAAQNLIKAGVPTKEASERISKAVQESIRKQMEARGDKGPVPQVKIETVGDGSMGVLIGLPDEQMRTNTKIEITIPDPPAAK
ncbi:MAG: FecR family protein [Candidatus Sumerlaeota bacterium]